MSDSLPSVTVTVPAKINLHLGVGPLRPDGYHELNTVFHAIDLTEQVLARPADGLSLVLDGPESDDLPTGADNLAWRAAELLAGHAGRRAEVDLTVTKRVPVAAGLAGGSADAAGVLLACDRLWQLQTPTAELAALAARLGSDVPFALQAGTAVGTGRGELLQPVPVGLVTHWVIAAARSRLSTPAVYAELDRQRAVGDARVPVGPAGPLLSAAARGDLDSLAQLLGNDLQPAALALAPELGATLDAGHRAGSLAGIVSGSGPTCVFLARDAEHARVIAGELNRGGSCRFALVATGNASIDLRLGDPSATSELRSGELVSGEQQ